MISLMIAPILAGMILPTLAFHPEDDSHAEWLAPLQGLVQEINVQVDVHHGQKGLEPAGRMDDAAFLRRVTLDLAGRIPTFAETQGFLADSSPDKREHVIRILLESPDFAIHWSYILDRMIQGKHAGDAEFTNYLKDSIRSRKPWNQIFQEVVLGPWDKEGKSSAAKKFILKRIKSIDDLTRDTTRVFFGVDIMCAKCHDHPLVDDWTQDHYYGMASFFNRTFEVKKGGGIIGEKADGLVEFVTREGDQKTARLMFLTGEVIPEPALAKDDPSAKSKPKKGGKKEYTPPVFSRREQLVKAAETEATFLSRSISNQLWSYLIGRGLVNPTDQMHSENPASIPSVLDLLAEDTRSHNYDLRRLIAAIALSQPYQRSDERNETTAQHREADFSVAQLRPLDARQFALSMIIATSDQSSLTTTDRTEREKVITGLISQARGIESELDPRKYNFQSSTTEALFMTNGTKVQNLVAPAGANLVSRLSTLKDVSQIIEEAVWTILSRPADPEETEALREFIEQAEDQSRAIRDMVWALVTSAEFRFNH